MITAIVNQKGGVGKSTTAEALAAGLKAKGKHTLVIDLDAQRNLTYTYRADTENATALDILQQHNTVNTIQHTQQGDIVAASRGLSAADTLLKDTGREYRLKEWLYTIKKEYDEIIIDTPPALGILTINALTAADNIIIPAQADIYSLQGIEELAGTIETVKRYTNSALTISGILITRYNGRAVLSKQITEYIEALAVKLNTKVFTSRIREAIAIKEAQAMRQNIFEYAPRAKVTQDYTEFINEYLKER